MATKHSFFLCVVRRTQAPLCNLMCAFTSSPLLFRYGVDFFLVRCIFYFTSRRSVECNFKESKCAFRNVLTTLICESNHTCACARILFFFFHWVEWLFLYILWKHLVCKTGAVHIWFIYLVYLFFIYISSLLLLLLLLLLVFWCFVEQIVGSYCCLAMNYYQTN